MKQRILLPLLLILALGLVACGGGEAAVEETAVSPESLTILMNDIYFSDVNDNVANPPVWEVTSGAEVTIQFDNVGALEHSWVVLNEGEAIPDLWDEAAHADKILFTSNNVPMNSDMTVTFTAPAPGEYQVVCNVPGHSGLMRGVLVVNS